MSGQALRQPASSQALQNPLFEEFTATDPTTGAGLQRPIGWRVLKPDGSAAWDKTGAGATAWSVVGSALGGVTTFNGVAGPITYNPNVTVANIAALAALTPPGGFSEGQRVRVQTLRDSFIAVNGLGLATDGINTINGATVGWQWIRALTPDTIWAARAAWSIDTTSGNDENDGATDLTAIKTIQELKRRTWGRAVSITATIRVLTDTASTDTGVWNTSFIGAGFFLFQCVLGASTGPGPTAHDNTLYSGSVTAINVPANVPSADEYTITDSAVPVSYTASGMLGTGVVFKRTNSTNLNWFALKDNGAKTMRATNPMNNIGAASWTALTVGDTYTAFQAPKIYAQDFGVWSVFVRFDSGDDEGSASIAPGYGCQYRRCYRSGASKVIIAGLHVNCLINLTSGGGLIYASAPQAIPQFNGGGWKGTGASTFTFNSGRFGLTGIYVMQGCSLVALECYMSLESASATHDFAGGAGTANYLSKGASTILFQIAQAGQGISGKGNTSKLLEVVQQGTFGYALGGATPPFTGSSTTDASPIVIGGASFSVASMPAALETVLTPSTFKNTLP